MRLTKEELQDKKLITFSEKFNCYFVDIENATRYTLDYLNHNVKTIYGQKEETIYVCRNNLWVPDGKLYIKSVIEEILGEFCKNKVVGEVLEKIKRQTSISREEFDKTPENLLPLLNGVLDLSNLDSIKLLPYKPEYYFKTNWPVYFNPEAKCPLILNFFEQTFHPEDLLQVQEWLGLHCKRRYLFKKIAILEGPPNTGKSVFVNLQNKLIGSQNVVGLSLQKIALGRSFDLLALKDKWANIVDDLSSKDMDSPGGIKQACGGAPITGEQKFGDLISFISSAKMTYTCNRIPTIKELDDPAYYGRFLRWLLDNQISEDEKDIYLLDKITTVEELSGLLNWSLEGLKRLIRQNKFSNEKSSDEMKELMLRSGNSISTFAKECLSEVSGEKISKEMAYENYCLFCQREGWSPCTKDQLGKSLARYIKTIPSSNGKERYWLNIKPNDKTNNDNYYTFTKTNSRLGTNSIEGKDMLLSNVSYPSKVVKDDNNDSLIKEEPKTDEDLEVS